MININYNTTMQTDLKALRAQAYKNRFKNRGKDGRSNYPKYPHGNIVRRAYGKGKFTKRINNGMVDNVDGKHHVVDVEDVNTMRPGKNILKGVIPHEGYTPVNTQCRQRPISEKIQKLVELGQRLRRKRYKKRKKNGKYAWGWRGRHDNVNGVDVFDHRPLCVNLDEIREGLYLSTVECVLRSDILKRYNIRTVVNLSHSHEFSRVDNEGVRYYNIPMQDNRRITLDEFMTIYYQVEEKIDRTDGAVVVVCRKGKNRSCAMVSTYGIYHKGMRPEEVVSYIEKEKADNFPLASWQTLENLHMRRLLISVHNDKLLIDKSAPKKIDDILEDDGLNSTGSGDELNYRECTLFGVPFKQIWPDKN